ncbi:MBL fold metallo-hydrolase [Desulfatitalea tepidiphila]|uniref:MBL fold metallo-hydrolase n=1 Tax=Desulfatitalea tepidiphila TaxID=1185843 RepID=UPI0006B51885|nr:MBL fold metallo-hydrolase [Desulfatitalea tepidiphila]
MSRSTINEADVYGHTSPTQTTIDINAQALKDLAADDLQDFEDARRGWIASVSDLKIVHPKGTAAWDQTAYRFVDGEAPPSVHPNLWRQAKLNNIHGLFEVAKGIYQLRGFDLANLTLIEGKTGWIVVDALTCRETATAALELAWKHLEPKPVVAMIFTHSHIDHFGDATAVIPAQDADNKKVRIVAPQGFMEESISESVLAGGGYGGDGYQGEPRVD